MLNRWICSAMASAALLASAGAHAARDFTPQAGTWIVSSELDGKPGRGLAIDVQGNTFFMQVFGYEKNGDATFYTATGQMDGNGVTAPLMRYQGGRSFGSGARDAVEDKSVGNVAVSFSNGLKGTVQFPGEQPVAIERFLVPSSVPGVINPLAQLGLRYLSMLAFDEQGQFVQHWYAMLNNAVPGKLLLGLKNEQGLAYVAYFDCASDADLKHLNCDYLSDNPFPQMPYLPLKEPVSHVQLRIAGDAVGGYVQVAGAHPRKLQLSGVFSDAVNNVCTDNYSYSYQHNFTTVFAARVCPQVPVAAQYQLQLMPLNGTWIVEDELTGKPGRGIALDIQGNTAILQIYNYRVDGQPTFHMASGQYSSSGVNTFASSAQLALAEYRQGRSLGGPAQSAVLSKVAGVAGLTFAQAGRHATPYWIAQGEIQLPNEPPVRIRRLLFDSPASVAESLLGEWYIPWAQRLIKLDHASANVATSADKSVSCAVESEFIAVCEQTDGAQVIWHQRLDLPLWGRAGNLVRLKDRYGNRVGLGQLD